MKKLLQFLFSRIRPNKSESLTLPFTQKLDTMTKEQSKNTTFQAAASRFTEIYLTKFHDSKIAVKTGVRSAEMLFEKTKNPTEQQISFVGAFLAHSPVPEKAIEKGLQAAESFGAEFENVADTTTEETASEKKTAKTK